MIVRIGDHRLRRLHRYQDRRIFGKFAEHHVVAPVAQAARQCHILFENYEKAVGAVEFLQQGFDGRSMAIEEHFAGHGRQHVLQANYKLLFEVGQYHHREYQEDQKLTDERRNDDEHGHERMVPAIVGALARVGNCFRRPLDALQKGARTGFQMLHAEHVDRAQSKHGRWQQDQQRQEVSGRTLEF